MTKQELVKSIQQAEPLFAKHAFQNYSINSLLRIKRGVEAKRGSKSPGKGSAGN